MQPYFPAFAAALAVSLALTSCDKAKDLANKATAAVKDGITSKTGGEKGSIVDPELRKLVDQTPEGAVFRKDLPFPARLSVRTTARREMSVRLYQTSAIGKRAETVNGTRVTIFNLERADHEVRHTLEQSSFSVPSPDADDGAMQNITDPLEQLAPSAKPVTFRKSGATWKSDEKDGFRAAALSRQLTPFLDELLIENAIAPRPRWFAGRRIKPGDKIPVTGDSLPMILAGNAKGSLTLTLESFEAVDGHPCGVFTITGDYSRKQFPDFDGNLTDEDVTIQSGKIWLSLIHPVVLREEFATIQTFKSGGHGGASVRGQGTIKVSVKRSWKPLAS
jgi:hypothetical protein